MFAGLGVNITKVHTLSETQQIVVSETSAST